MGAVVGQVLTLATTVIALDRLGTDGYAYVVLAQTLSQWPLLLEKGIGYALIRLFSADDPSASRPLVASALVLYLVLGALTLLLGLVAGQLLDIPLLRMPRRLRHEGFVAFELLFMAAAVRITTAYVPRALLGETRFVALRSVELLRDAIPLVITVLFVGEYERGITVFATALLLGDMAAAVCGIGVLGVRRRFGVRLRHASRAAFAWHLRNSGPVLIGGATGFLSSRLDPIIVSVALGPAATSTYGLVLRVLEPLAGAVELVSAGVSPATYRMIEAGAPSRVAAMFVKVTRYGALALWPAACVVAVLAGPVGEWWLDADVLQLEAATIAAMGLLVLLPVAVTAGDVIVGADRVAEMAKPTVLGVIANLAVSILLVNAIGVAAVFIGSALGTALEFWFSLRIAADVAQEYWSRLLSGLLLPALLAGAFASLLVVARLSNLDGPELLTVAVVGGVAYAGAALRYAIPRTDLLRMLGRSTTTP